MFEGYFCLPIPKQTFLSNTVLSISLSIIMPSHRLRSKQRFLKYARKKPAKISFQLLCQMQCPCSKSLPTDSFFLIIASDSHAYAKKRIKFAINCKLIRFFNLKHIFFPASKNLFRFFFGFLIEFSVHLLHVAVKSTIKNGSIAIF